MSHTIHHRLAEYGLAFGLVIAGLLVPLAMSRHIVLDDERVEEALDDGAGYDEIVDVVCDEVADAESMRTLADTPLAMNRQEIREAVESELERDTVAHIIESVYRQTMKRVLNESEKKVVADVTKARRQVLEGLRKRLVRILNNLPDCDASDDIGTLWSAVEGTITGESGGDMLSGWPHCKPMGPIRERIEKAIEKRTRSLHHDQKVELEAVEARGIVVAVFRWVDVWASGWWLVPWVGLIAFSMIAFAWSRGSRGVGLAPSVRRGFMILGSAWLVLAALVFWLATPIFRMTASRPESADIGAPLVTSLATAVAWRVAALGFALLVIAGAVHWRMRRS